MMRTMKRMVLFISCLVMMLASTSAFALSFSDNYPLYKVESFEPNGYCYLYSKPSSLDNASRNLGRYENGAFVKVIEWNCENGFSYVICTNGQTGYINSSSLTRYSDTLNRKVYRVESTQPAGYCYMYDQPSDMNGRNLGRYDNGTLVLIVDWDADQTFAKVRIWNENKYGYIRKTCLAMASSQR